MGSGLGTFLASIVGPLAKKIMIALGFGVASYAAVATALASALGAAKAAYGGMSADVLALVDLAGVGVAASILAGALTARVSLQVLKKFELK